MHVRNAELECVWIAGDVTCEQRVAREIAIGPHDEARVRVLRGEERLERVFLSLAKGRQVGAPIGMIVRARTVGRKRGGRQRADGARKVVAVEAEAHGHASVDLGDLRTVQSLADVVGRRNLLGIEAPAQGGQRLDLLPDPRTQVKRKFYVWLPGEIREKKEEQDDWGRVLEACPRARPARPPVVGIAVVVPVVWGVCV